MKIINKNSWVYRVILLALLFIAIQFPPIAVQFANAYAHNYLVVAGFMLLFIVLMLGIIWWAKNSYDTYNQLGASKGIKIGWIICSYIVIILGMDVLGVLNQVIYHQTETANNAALGSMLGHNELITIVFMFSAVIFSPIAEEFIFRGTLTNMFLNVEIFGQRLFYQACYFQQGI